MCLKKFHPRLRPSSGLLKNQIKDNIIQVLLLSITGVAVIVSDMPQDQISEALKELCLVQVKPLCDLIEKQTKPVKNTKSDPVFWLDRLAAIFKHTTPKVVCEPHPCAVVIDELWPVLSKTCDTYQADARIMEHSCRCLRYIFYFVHLLLLLLIILKYLIYIKSNKG